MAKRDIAKKKSLRYYIAQSNLGGHPIWFPRTRHCNVPIVASSLPLAPQSRNFSAPRAIPTNPSAVRHAVDNAARSGLTRTAAVISRNVRCTRRYVPNAVRKLRYPSSHVRTGRYIVAIVTQRSGSNRADSCVFARFARLTG